MKSHLLVIKVFIVVGGAWLYVIRPQQMPLAQKLGPAPMVEQATRFHFPKLSPIDETEALMKVSGEHRELSLREISSVAVETKNADTKVDASSKEKKESESLIH